MTTRALHVYIVDDNNFTVVDDEGNIADRLCWDEMIGCLAESTHPIITPVRRGRYIQTPDEWDYMRYRYRPRAINEVR